MAQRPNAVPPLRAGDRLTRHEFERRWDAMPELKVAELLDGVVFLPETGTHLGQGRPLAHLVGISGLYTFATHGVEGGCHSSLRLDDHNEPQPDALLLIKRCHGGRAREDASGFLVSVPEWIGEVTANRDSYDLGVKMQVYRRFGAKEYLVWRVLDRQIDYFVSRNEQFEPLPRSPRGFYESETLPGLWFDPQALIEGNLARAAQVIHLGLASPEHQQFVNVLQRAEKRQQLGRSLLFTALCCIAFLIALHPAVHQFVFGPRVGGVSLWYRQWQFRHDYASRGFQQSWLTRAADWFGLRRSNKQHLPWHELSCEDRSLLASSLCADPDPFIRRIAVRSFQSRPVLPEYVAQVTELLDDPDPEVARAAHHTLSDWGTRAAASAPRLRELLNDPDPQQRLSAASVLWDVSGDVTEALPYLLAGLHAPDARYREATMRVLLYKEERATVLKNEILRALQRDRDQEVRWLAVKCLSFLGSDCLPHLVKAINDPQENIRCAAVEGLARFPDAVTELRPILRSLLRDPDENVRGYASQTLLRIDPTYVPDDDAG